MKQYNSEEKTRRFVKQILQSYYVFNDSNFLLWLKGFWEQTLCVYFSKIIETLFTTF